MRISSWGSTLKNKTNKPKTTFYRIHFHACTQLCIVNVISEISGSPRGRRYPGCQRVFMPGFRLQHAKLVLVVFSPLVSSAEQREKNLWYPGYAFPSLGYIVYTSVTWPIVKNAWRHCALSLDVKNPFFPRPFCYDRRVHMTALCAYHCDNIMAHGHLTKRKYQFTSRGNILQSPSQCVGASRSPKEHYLDDWEISPNFNILKETRYNYNEEFASWHAWAGLLPWKPR